MIFGREYLQAFRTALGNRADAMIVQETSYQAQDPTIDQQLLALRGAGANVLLAVAIPRFAALVIRRTAEMNWKPLQIIPQPSISIAATLRPAGVANAVGVISAEIYKDSADPRWGTDPEMVAYHEFMRQYRPSADMSDRMNLLGYAAAAAVLLL